jgi:hypothetical protein
MNTSLYVSIEGVDSQKGRLGRYYGDFSHNYIEYRLKSSNITFLKKFFLGGHGLPQDFLEY